jgi:hypothetical protein
MWLDRKIYQSLRDDYTKANAECALLAQHNRAIEATMNWLTVRVTQLEHERALLLQNYLGVTVPSLSIEKVTPSTSIRPSYDPVPHFDDIGDEEAKRMGVDWNPETGEIAYSTETN